MDGIESCIHVTQVREALKEQASADEEHDR
jgi:hypothetical protein